MDKNINKNQQTILNLFNVNICQRQGRANKPYFYIPKMECGQNPCRVPPCPPHSPSNPSDRTGKSLEIRKLEKTCFLTEKTWFLS